MVLSDENSYYAWGEIEKVRAKMLADEREVAFVDYGAGRPHPTSPTKGRGRDYRRICDIAKGSLAKKKYAQMLARLVNWLGDGLTIVELGTSLGVTTAYMAAMDKRNKVITYEGCPAVAEIAKENWEA
jgi:protein-L-isoaspartate O-methyltransferase